MRIQELGNPLLRAIALPVEDISRPDIQQLIEDMKETLNQKNGVGIAAPQISIGLRIFIVASRANARYPKAPYREAFAVINPSILETSNETIKDREGCLSIPGIRGLVPRYQWIRVQYYNEQGVLQEERLEGFLARIFQHEYDHLEGIVFLDRLESNKDIITEKEYKKMMS